MCIFMVGEGEFSSRLQRFKAPTPLNSPSRSTPCTRNLSSFVHGIQNQLNTAVTPSNKEASRIRQVDLSHPSDLFSNGFWNKSLREGYVLLLNLVSLTVSNAGTWGWVASIEGSASGRKHVVEEESVWLLPHWGEPIRLRCLSAYCANLSWFWTFRSLVQK